MLTMESLSVVSFSSPPPTQNHPKTLKTTITSNSTNLFRNYTQNHLRIFKSFASQTSISYQSHLSPTSLNTHATTNQISKPKTPSKFLQNHHLIRAASSSEKTTTTHFPNLFENHNLERKTVFSLKTVASAITIMNPLLLMRLFAPFPCFAIETTLSREQLSDKTSLESVLISIDEFFNRNPLFGPFVAFIWLVAIPLTQEYLNKFKFISAFSAFKKLRDDPSSQLLDIRDKQSLLYLGSPNLRMLNKRTVQVQYSEGNEDGFVRKVLENFRNPSNINICILDNFDGNSLKVAELLVKNGFKEAYAIKSGLRGKDGWQEIQETLLPPSLHVWPKQDKTSQLEINGEETSGQTEDNNQNPSPTSVPVSRSGRMGNGNINSIGPYPEANHGSRRPSSPYPNYPDMKPPSSPTPSKPRS